MKSLFILMVVVFLGSLTSFTYAESRREDSHEGLEHHESAEYHTIRVLSTKKVDKKKVVKKSIKKSGIDQRNSIIKPVTTSSGSAASINALVSYGTPEGSVSVGFSVTMKGGIITAASATKKASGTSGYYQDSFIQGLSKAVVGKKVSDLHLEAIGGASLTTAAFEKFVKQ